MKMNNQSQKQQQEYNVKNVSKQKMGQDTVEVEWSVQDGYGKKKEDQQEKEKKYVMSRKVSWKERRKDRKKRQKSWMVVNQPVSEMSVMESRMSR